MFRDRYRIDSLLGQGGMGSVYKATDTLLRRVVAIKTLRAHLFQNRNSLMRLGREARAISSLNHPHIVKVLDLAGLEEGNPYIVMEYIAGGELSDLIKQNQFLDEETFLHLVFQICSALSHAHERRILHRDLKPSNILLEHQADGLHAKLLDFSYSRFLDEEQKITHSGEFLGTPYYMSPEQCQGHRLDVRSDVYSFGCCMYEMLTGTPPFVGQSTLKTIQMHLEEAPFKLTLARTDLPHGAALERIVEKALAKEPSKRHRSIQELRHDLRNLADVSYEQEEEPVVSFWDQLPHLLGRKAAIAGIVGLAVTAAGIGWMVHKTVDQGHADSSPAEVMPPTAVPGKGVRRSQSATNLSANGLKNSVLAKRFDVWKPAGSKDQGNSSNVPQKVQQIDFDGQVLFDQGDLSGAKRKFTQGLRESGGLTGRASIAPFILSCNLIDVALAQGQDSRTLKTQINSVLSSEYFGEKAANWQQMLHSRDQLKTAVEEAQGSGSSLSMQDTWLELARSTNHRVMQVLQDFRAQTIVLNDDVMDVTRLNERLLNSLESNAGAEPDRSLRLEHLRALVLYQTCLRAHRQEKEPIGLNDGLCRKLIADVREPDMVEWLAVIADSMANRQYEANADILIAAFADYAANLKSGGHSLPPQELAGLAWAKLGTANAYIIKHDYDNAKWWLANAKSQFTVLEHTNVYYLNTTSGELIGPEAAKKGAAQCDVDLAGLEQMIGRSDEAGDILKKTLRYSETWLPAEDETQLILSMLAQRSDSLKNQNIDRSNYLKRVKAIYQRNDMLLRAVASAKH